MVEGTDPIKRDIDSLRSSMTETLEEIESRVRTTVDTTVDNVRQAFDLKQQVSDRPWMSLGLALAAGYMLGSMGDERPPQPRYGEPGQPMRYYPSDETRPRTEQFTERPDSPQYRAAGHTNGAATSDYSDDGGIGGMLSRLASPLNSELQMMASAAINSAVRVLRESLQDSIPQFGSEYQRVRAQRGRTEQSPPSAANGGMGGMETSEERVGVGRSSYMATDTSETYR